MSWQPGHDPVQGNVPSCEAIELMVVPRARDIGGFEVRRALPHIRRQMVGPFIFFDQMGPAQFLAGQGMDVRPHPHIGLATVTYLFDGRIMHRDSEGNALEITPGALNLMTAGRGIAHSERSPADARRTTQPMFGIQSWIALPRSCEEIAPSFQHVGADQLPLVGDAGLRARVIAGSAFGATSPVETLTETLYVDLSLQPGAAVPLDPDYEDRALYVAAGTVEIAGDRFEAPQLLVFRPGDSITVRAVTPCRLMLLGGATMDGPRHIWWNFVSSSRERIEQAKEDWRSGRFPPVPGESEFIPLPGA
ncbi:pirin family protein [Oleisolibacter albus]|uniref:pirin family protein n=1 Tax=Oleisolibacter albus TaxID=2171757 RepID=UPI000DF1AD84|nr:pirin family protein [Oleisolibacter albus]